VALNLWTIGEEATAGGPAQAEDRNSLIYVHTTAGRGKIKIVSPNNGDMWIVPAARVRKKAV
jgi:hypothetical protein